MRDEPAGFTQGGNSAIDIARKDISYPLREATFFVAARASYDARF